VGQQEWEEVPIEGAITAGLPQASNPLQRCWNQFFREFVADVKGEGYMGYPLSRWLHSGSSYRHCTGSDGKVLHSGE
jgi:hypothetical protein